VFREHFDTCAGLLGFDLAEALRGEQLGQTRITQPALFTVEYALAKLWQSKGIQPAAMAGHSIGEYVAACLAGVFDLEDALAIVATRGRLMQAMPVGAMLSVSLPADELVLPPGVELAAANAPRLSVVAGERDAVAAYAGRLRGGGVKCRELHTSHAFHSAMMDPVVAEFAEFVGGFVLRAPRIPVLSNVTGDWLADGDARDPGYWARQLRAPVRFDDCASRLLARPHALLEVGPGTTLTTLVGQHPGAPARATASLGGPKSSESERVAMAGALGRLWLAGVAVEWPRAKRHVPLPTYPFQRERHWVGPAAIPAPAPETVLPDQDRTPLAVVREIWAELLGLPDIGVDDDFFVLGGHSLLGTKVVARIREALGVDLPAGAVFDTPTIAGLAAAVEQLLATDPMAELLAEIRALSPEELRAQLAATRGEDR
jgi:acyl transferase domain-containing protein